MAKTKGYYDIDFDVEEILSREGTPEEIFYMQDVRQRKFYINQDIEPIAVADAVRHILQINREDDGIPVEERKPVKLYLASNGGQVDPGFMLIDTILTSITPVYTINLGYWYSMGFLIGLAGHKRFSMPNAKFLLHDGANFIYNSGAKAQDQMNFNKHVEDRTRAYVLGRTKITPEEYDGNLRVEWYMFAEEAQEKGVVDCIIGRDCPVTEVV